MGSTHDRTGRRIGAVVLTAGALLALAVSPAFAHTNASSVGAARHALLAAELIGAESDEVGEIETLLDGDQAGVDQADATDTSAANDQADTGDQAQTKTPDKAQVDSNDQGENEQADSSDQGGDQADHQDGGGSGDQGNSGDSGDSSGGDSGD
jgi:hypothetical protein